MSLSASPRSTLCRSLATSTSSSTGLVDTGRRLGQYSGQGLAKPPTPTKGPCHHPTLPTHCGCRKKLYWHMIVRKNPTKPSTVMATSPRVTMSHSNGDFILSNWPVEQLVQGLRASGRAKSPQPWNSQGLGLGMSPCGPLKASTVPSTRLTDLGIVFVDVLVVGHLHESMAQVVVGEDEEATFQVAVDNLQILGARHSSVSPPQATPCGSATPHLPCHAQRAAEGRWPRWL